MANLTSNGGSVLLKSRPDFGTGQIKDVKDLQVGVIYYRCHASKSGGQDKTKIKILEIGKKKLKVLVLWDNPLALEISLSDHNLLPYRDGMWNPSNWIEKLEVE